MNAGWVTTFNEYAIVGETLYFIPEDIPKKEAALFDVKFTGFGVVGNNAIKMGESVVVFGAGGIGLNIVQAIN